MPHGIVELQMKEYMPLFNKLIVKRVLNFIRKFFSKLVEDDAFGLAAALAYYAVFSLAPFLYILVNALGLLFNQVEVRNSIFEGLAEMIGPKGADQLKLTLVNMGVMDAGWLNNVIGLVILLITATTIFAAIQNGLNYIFRVKAKGNSGILKYFKTRLLAFAVIMGLAFIILISLVANGLIALFSDWIIYYIPGLERILYSLNSFFFPFLISWIVFLIIFKYLPDVITAWKDLIVGSFFTAVLFAFGRYLIGFYVGSSNIGNVYDASGAIMVIFIWMYYSSFIFYLGAIFTVLYAEEFGSGVIAHQNMHRFIQKELELEE